MEKGEVGILALQFGALAIAVLLLSNFAYGTNSSSTPSVTAVYWGAPPPGVGVKIGTGTHTETTNASQISAFYSLAPGTHLDSISASRLCTTEQTNATSQGDEYDYTYIPRYYDSSNKAYYFTFGPTGQPAGWSCLYTIAVTDSLEQGVSWTSTVIVQPAAASG